MTAPGVEAKTPRTRWFRRRPPEAMSSFARSVWWAGHGQLFLAVMCAVTGSFCIAVVLGPPWLGILLAAAALPFAVSGLLLRAHAVRQQGLDGKALTGRVIELALVAVVLTILWVVLVVIDWIILMWTIGLILTFGLGAW